MLGVFFIDEEVRITVLTLPIDRIIARLIIVNTHE